MLTIIRAGLAPVFVPYERGRQLQRDIHARVSQGEAPDSLVLLEHDPVYTAGTRTTVSERPADGTPVVDVDRGGKTEQIGFAGVLAGPLVRSSYRAGRLWAQTMLAQGRETTPELQHLAEKGFAQAAVAG